MNSDTTTPTLTAYTVTLNVPGGEMQIDLKAFSPEKAGNRAWLAAVHNGYGDVDDVTVASVELCLDWDDNPGF